jgi:hypothetical protein
LASFSKVNYLLEVSHFQLVLFLGVETLLLLLLFIIIIIIIIIIFYDEKPYKKKVISCTHPFHMNRIILRLRQQADPKKLFTPKKIRTLEFMGLPQKPRLLPLEP